MEYKKKVSLTVTGTLWDKYKLFCAKNGMKLSTRIELLIEKDLESEKK
jgi:macrodomain Ter protein organizer (MatP/YcbG family)